MSAAVSAPSSRLQAASRVTTTSFTTAKSCDIWATRASGVIPRTGSGPDRRPRWPNGAGAAATWTDGPNSRNSICRRSLSCTHSLPSAGRRASAWLMMSVSCCCDCHRPSRSGSAGPICACVRPVNFCALPRSCWYAALSSSSSRLPAAREIRAFHSESAASICSKVIPKVYQKRPRFRQPQTGGGEERQAEN